MVAVVVSNVYITIPTRWVSLSVFYICYEQKKKKKSLPTIHTKKCSQKQCVHSLKEKNMSLSQVSLSFPLRASSRLSRPSQKPSLNNYWISQQINQSDTTSERLLPIQGYTPYLIKRQKKIRTAQPQGARIYIFNGRYFCLQSSIDRVRV